MKRSGTMLCRRHLSVLMGNSRWGFDDMRNRYSASWPWMTVELHSDHIQFRRKFFFVLNEFYLHKVDVIDISLCKGLLLMPNGISVRHKSIELPPILEIYSWHSQRLFLTMKKWLYGEYDGSCDVDLPRWI